MTTTNQVLGTPRYMAPEQHWRPREVDGKADVYALGLILHELATGKLPEGGPDTGYEDLDSVVWRANERDPEKRFATVAELRKDLKPFADSMTAEGRIKSWVFAFSPWILLFCMAAVTAYTGYEGRMVLLPWFFQILILWLVGYFNILEAPKSARYRRKGWLGCVLMLVGYNLIGHLLDPSGWIPMSLWIDGIFLIPLSINLLKPRMRAVLESVARIRAQRHGVEDPWSEGPRLAALLFGIPWLFLTYFCLMLVGLIAWQFFVPAKDQHWIDVILAVLTAAPFALALWRDLARSRAASAAEV
jgi:serine/threonine protein kinase